MVGYKDPNLMKKTEKEKNIHLSVLSSLTYSSK